MIALVDDDNIPLDGWGENLLVGKEITCDVYTAKYCPVFDPLSVPKKYKHIWHRGFPIQYVNKKNMIEKTTDTYVPSIQADLWNGDPDVDAICRMEHAPECDFSDDDVFPYGTTQPSPFNSQNTFILRSVVRDYFILPYIGRMDDIWAAYYCESQGHRVVYNRPSVYQQRNNHNLTTDFENEIIGYVNTEKIFKNVLEFIPKKSLDAFNEYRSLIS